MMTYEEWLRLVKGFVSTKSATEAKSIANLCCNNPEWGVWHAASVFYKTKCMCAKCLPGPIAKSTRRV